MKLSKIRNFWSVRKKHIFFQTRAQVQSQIFIYIIAIVVVGLILLFGYNAVRDFGERAGQVALIQFEQDMTSTFHTISTSYGKVEIKKVEVPGGFDTVCFVDLDLVLSSTKLAYDGVDYPIITESVQSDTKKNLFLVGGLDIESYYLGDIRIQANNVLSSFICFKGIQGRIEIKLFGRGDHVLVTDAQ